MDSIDKIRDEFYLKAKDNVFYLQNSFNEALYRLTNFVDEYFAFSILNDVDNIEHIGSEITDCYSTIIKRINKYIPNINDEINKNSLEKPLRDLKSEFEDSYLFNLINRFFDRTQTGAVKATIKNCVIEFEFNNKRDFNFELYSRWVSLEQPLLKGRILGSISTIRSNADIFNKKYNKLWDEEKQSPKNKFLLSLIAKNCYSRFMDELLDIREDVQFKEFSLDEFRQVYSVVEALGVAKLNRYLHQLTFDKNEQNDPSVAMDFETFIDILESLTNVEKHKIDTIINMLTYDYSFHIDKEIIYQPLLLSVNKIFFSTMLVYTSLAQDKILFCLNKQQKNPQAISKVSSLREQLMTKEINEFIEHYSDLKSETGYVLFKSNGEKQAEYDLILLDEKNKSILVCELKWFFKYDGELDLLNIDRRLSSIANNRIKRNKLFLQFKNKIISDLFNSKIDESYEISFCIISENEVGSSSLEDDLCIFDRFSFYDLLNETEFNLKEFSTILKTENYLPNIPLKTKYEIFEYHGQKFKRPVN